MAQNRIELNEAALEEVVGGNICMDWVNKTLNIKGESTVYTCVKPCLDVDTAIKTNYVALGKDDAKMVKYLLDNGYIA